MSLAIVYSRAHYGVQAPLVHVEVHLSFGMPGFSIVGLPETAVKESRDRVRSAIMNSQFRFPADRRITVNLGPAELPKEGTHFDLPIAIGILAASEQVPPHLLADHELIGELALNGELRSVQGALPLALGTKQAQRKLILPKKNEEETGWIVSDIYPAESLLAVANHFHHHTLSRSVPAAVDSVDSLLSIYTEDFSDIIGQSYAKRAFEIAASGRHNVLMMGPPGTGKTMLASRFPTILPDLTEEEALSVAAIYSLSHQGFQKNAWKKRPFRQPHHTASGVALVGGGGNPRPGEISLAHQGVLFLDELPEFQRRVLEVLREPLESGKITISRAARQVEFPADFQLICAMNPCPCGYLGDTHRACTCSREQVQRYRSRISGPLLDRIDMHLAILPPPDMPALQSLSETRSAESMVIKARVEQAVKRQWKRQRAFNARLSSPEIASVSNMTPTAKQYLDKAAAQKQYSLRKYYRVMKVARTIADLAESDTLEAEHVLEAIGYREGF